MASEAPNVGGRIYNMADGKQTSLLRLLELLSTLLGKTIEPIFEPARVGDVRESLADITQARKVLGYEPKIALEPGLRATIDYYKSISSG